MLTFYRNNQPFVIFSIVFTAFVLWTPYFINPEVFLRDLTFQKQPLDIMSLVYSWNKYFLFSISLILCLFLAFQVSYINLSQQLIEKRNYLPALFFLLSMSWIPDLKIHVNSQIALIFIAFAFNIMLSSYSQKNNLFAFFDTGLLIGLASLFYFPFSVFLLVLGIAIILFQMPAWRNFLTSIIAFLVPWLFYYGIYYFINGSVIELNQLINNLLFSSQAFRDFNALQWIFTGVSILTILLSSVHFVKNINHMTVRGKRVFYLFLWTFIILLIQYFVLPIHESMILLGVAIPLSFLFTLYFSVIKSNWKGNLIFNFYFFSILIAQYMFVFKAEIF